MRSSATLFLLVILAIGCTPTKESGDTASKLGSNDWTIQRTLTKDTENYHFVFPAEGYAYEHRDSLVDACMSAIRQNMELLKVDSMKVPYRITFYPSKAAMKKATNTGVSGQADFWNKTVGFVSTDDPETIEKENIIPPPITHETMHMIAMETWGYPQESNLWMNEGLATFAANSCNGRTVREVHNYLLTHDMTFPMDSLTGQFYACNEMIGYHQAASIVQYLLEHYGVEKFGAFWQAGFSEFELIYGTTFPEVEAKLNAEVRAAYPEGVELDWEVFKKGCK